MSESSENRLTPGEQAARQPAGTTRSAPRWDGPLAQAAHDTGVDIDALEDAPLRIRSGRGRHGL